MVAPQPSNPWRYFHLGLELAGAIVVLGLIGLWVDYRWGTGPWGVLIGVLVGAVGGMYLFIKDALRAIGQFSYDRNDRHHGAPRRDAQGSGRDDRTAEHDEPADAEPPPDQASPRQANDKDRRSDGTDGT